MARREMPVDCATEHVEAHHDGQVGGECFALSLFQQAHQVGEGVLRELSSLFRLHLLVLPLLGAEKREICAPFFPSRAYGGLRGAWPRPLPRFSRGRSKVETETRDVADRSARGARKTVGKQRHPGKPGVRG